VVGTGFEYSILVVPRNVLDLDRNKKTAT